jgi:hypothetical protein
MEQRIREGRTAFGWTRTVLKAAKAHWDIAKETIAPEAEETVATPVVQNTSERVPPRLTSGFCSFFSAGDV